MYQEDQMCIWQTRNTLLWIFCWGGKNEHASHELIMRYVFKASVRLQFSLCEENSELMSTTIYLPEDHDIS